MKSNHSLRKTERIVSQKIIDNLFSSTGSHSLVAFPIRAVYTIQCDSRSEESQQDATPHVQILVSVPKRRFHHAVDRNRVKRQLREAYRHNKLLIASRLPSGQTLSIAFIWLTDQHLPSDIIFSRMQTLLKRIADRL